MMPSAEPPFRVGERFARRVALDADSIRQFAAMAGDHDPLNHRAAAGAGSPFGRIIARGPHAVAQMLELDAALSRRGDSLGRRFEFRFVEAIPAGIEPTSNGR